MSDNSTFWKTMSSFWIDKINKTDKDIASRGLFHHF